MCHPAVRLLPLALLALPLALAPGSLLAEEPDRDAADRTISAPLGILTGQDVPEVAGEPDPAGSGTGSADQDRRGGGSDRNCDDPRENYRLEAHLVGGISVHRQTCENFKRILVNLLVLPIVDVVEVEFFGSDTSADAALIINLEDGTVWDYDEVTHAGGLPTDTGENPGPEVLPILKKAPSDGPEPGSLYQWLRQSYTFSSKLRGKEGDAEELFVASEIAESFDCSDVERTARFVNSNLQPRKKHPSGDPPEARWVAMGQWMTADLKQGVRYLQTWNAGPCITLILYNRCKKRGSIAHFNLNPFKSKRLPGDEGPFESGPVDIEESLKKMIATLLDD